MRRGKMKPGKRKALLVNLMRATLIISFIVAAFFAGCAHLREGWVKVDYLEGKPSDIMVCEMKIKSDDVTAKCLSLEAALEMAKPVKKSSDWSL